MDIEARKRISELAPRRREYTRGERASYCPLKCLVRLLIILLAAALFPSAGSAQDEVIQPLEVDLEQMAGLMETRYYLSERGELPPKYILIGGLSLRSSFLDTDFDLRERIIEYDDESGLIYSFRVPGHVRFIRRSEREGAFFKYSIRPVTEPEIEIEIITRDQRVLTVKHSTYETVRLEDIRYNLEREREDVAGRGLLSLDIPLPLPSQIEAIIGSGDATNLTVQGRESITIGGQSSWCANCPLTEGRPKQRKFPDLDMEQRLSVNLHGNIGEKINVEIQHSSQGDMQATNRVRLNYRGFDDEIVQLIEMGDTDLTLSGAQLISYSGSAKGLFGVKGMAQIGPLDLTVIASKEEGETATGAFSAAGGQSSQYTVEDYDFIKRQFFYFETPGQSYENPHSGFFDVRPVYGGDDNDEIEVLVSLLPNEILDEEGRYWFVAYADPENNGLSDTVTVAEGGARWEGFFKELSQDNGDFQLIQDYSEDGSIVYLGIRLTQRLANDRALAVRYKARNRDTGETFLVGDYQNWTGVLKAELICPRYDELAPDARYDEFGPDSTITDYPSTWRMMMRNVYSLGSTNMEEGTIDIRIEDVTNRANKDIHEASGLSYIRLFGLDRYDRQGNVGKDDIVDDLPGIIDLTYGFIMLPWYEGFNPPEWVMRGSTPPFIDTLVYSDEADFDYSTLELDTLIYNAVITSEVIRSGHKYNLVIESTSGQRTFQLNAFEIIEGSEVVTVDGVKLARGVDYTIDYISGVVSLQGDILTEMTPDSRVSIDYQHKPLVGGGKNSLLGIGANLNLSTHSRLNATFLYNSVGAPKYTPRLGEEPVRTMAADLNGSFQFNPEWMTSLVNVLPRVDTDSESSLNMSGEVALSIPNPNVKGEAFVDDMEGVEDSDMIPMGRRAWYEASPPLDSLNTEIKLPSDTVPEFYWFNVTREVQSPLIATRRDLNPGLDERENSTVSSLFIHPIDPEEGEWCGVMTGFPGGGLDLTNAQYLEIWVNDFDIDTLASNRGGVLHIDFGRIDEDFYQPDSATSDGRSFWNDEVTEYPYVWTFEQDTGFRDENCSYPTNFKDEYYESDILTFPGINCRSGNGLHDTEDLNSNGRLDTVNAYYTIDLPLSREAIIDVRRDFDQDEYSNYWNDEDIRDENKTKAWRMYRIDLSKTELISPSGAVPRWDAIQHMRLWITDVENLGHVPISGDEERGGRGPLLEIAEVKLVGNRWERDGIRDHDGGLPSENRDPLQKMVLGTINNKDNPSVYRPPYEVTLEEGLQNREQSLLMTFENFADSTSFQAVKRFFGLGQNFQEYREIQFFIRPDIDMVGTEFYFRIAFDSANYYEIAVPFEDADANRWIGSVISLSDLTSLKLLPGEEGVSKEIRDLVDPSRSYMAKLVGLPTLFQVRYLFIGVRNATGQLIPQGSLWFNDIRLGGVRKDIDMAQRASFSANFGNVLQFNGSWQRTGPEFRSLRQKHGSGLETSNINLGGKTKVNHFIPTAGFDLPVTGKYANSKSLPKYMPQSDVEILDDALRSEQSTVNTSYAFTVSMSRRNSSNLLMRHLFDKLRTSFSYSNRNLQSPNARDTTTTMSGNLNYSANFRKDRQISLFRGVKWRYWLSSFSLQSAGSRRVRNYYAITAGELVRRPATYDARWNSSVSMLYEPFESIDIDFGIRENRNAAIDHYFLGIPIGVQTNFSHDFKLMFQPTGVMFFLSQFNPRFEYKTRYTEDLNPSIRQGEDPFGTRNIGATRSMNFVFDIDVGTYAIDFGKRVKLLERDDKERESTRGTRGRFFESPEKDAFNKRVEEHEKQQEAKEETRLRPVPIEIPYSKLKESEEEEEEKKRAAGLDDLTARRPRDATIGDKTEEAAVDSIKAADADTTEAEGADPLLAVKQLLKFIGGIDPIKTSINMDHNSNYQRVYDRASLLYQFGITDDTDAVGKSGGVERNPDRSTDNFNMNFRTGFSLTKSIKIDTKLTYAKRRDNYSGRVTETDRMTWPSFNMSWSGLERIQMLQRMIESSDITLNYERRKSKDARGEETSTTFSPNWNFVWRNKLSTNLAFSYRSTSRIERSQDLWSRSWSVNVNARYNFEGSKGFGLPLPFLSSKRIKFKSTLTTDVSVGYSSSSKYNQPSANTLSIAPIASYKFSKRMSGSIAFNYKRSSGGIYGYINHSVGLHFTADFIF